MLWFSLAVLTCYCKFVDVLHVVPMRFLQRSICGYFLQTSVWEDTAGRKIPCDMIMSGLRWLAAENNHQAMRRNTAALVEDGGGHVQSTAVCLASCVCECLRRGESVNELNITLLEPGSHGVCHADAGTVLSSGIPCLTFVT